MTASELLSSLLAAFQAAETGADFREAYGPEPASRRRGRPLVTGRVEKESLAGEDWSAKLGFTVYLPGGEKPGEARRIAKGMAAVAKEAQPLLTEVQMGAMAPEKALGGLAMSCAFQFGSGSGTGSSGSRQKYTVTINGQAYTATGWKESAGGSETALVAIGEEEAFYRKGRTEYSVELQGLNAAGLAGVEDFTLRLGDGPWLYSGCRWKSFSASGTAVAVAGGRTKIDTEKGE